MVRRLINVLWKVREGQTQDPWRGSEGTLIAEFREKLDVLAENLSCGGQTIHTRFNSVALCAELCTEAEGVFARVVVKWTGGRPCRIIVTHTPFFQKDWEREFEELLPGGRVWFLPFKNLSQ